MRVRSAGASPTPSAASIGAAPGPRRPGGFTAVLGERGAPPAAASPAPSPVPRPHRPRVGAAGISPAPSPVRALLEQAAGSEQRVDALLAGAARGRTFSPAELLALQATVFRYSQAVEVVSRAADKLVGAVKQTMGTQV